MELRPEKCKGCIWGTNAGNCILKGEVTMTCKANDFSNFKEANRRE